MMDNNRGNGYLGGEKFFTKVVETRSIALLTWHSIKLALAYSLFLFSPFNHPNIKKNLLYSLATFVGYLTILFWVHHALNIPSIPQLMYPICVSFIFASSFLLSLYFAICETPPFYPSSFVVSPFDQSNIPTLFVSARNGKPLPLHVRVSISYVVFVLVAGVSASTGLVLLSGLWSFGVFINGFATGVVFGVHYLYNKRWVLRFPIIQRRPFFSFKLGIHVVALKALRWCVVACVFSAILELFVPTESESHATNGEFISKQMTFTENFVIFLCYELNHHLHQVLRTKRVAFAPPEGSAAAETNPSEPLLNALEESRPRSLIQYLAYLDLCMVCENNVDTWRRAAFFEGTGKTYKRIMITCLKHLEKLILDLRESLETNDSADKSFQLSNQLKQPADLQLESRNHEAFYDFQLCAWCARIAASLIVHVHKEDSFEISQLDSYADVMSALLSCLLAIEAFIGKETNLQSPQLTDPGNVKCGVILKKRGTLYSKAYSMADTLRTSINCIVSAFHNEMTSSNLAILDMVWVTNKPLFGTREVLLQKLCLFLEFRAN